MNKLLIAAAFMALAVPVAAEPIDMTGWSCVESTSLGKRTWEFYGDKVIRYYEDGFVSSHSRIGEGAYEKYNRAGDWTAVYYFFDRGDGVQIRILSRPGLIALEENPHSPLDKQVRPFHAECVPLWELQ